MLNCAMKERQPFFVMSIIALISLSIFIASCELDGGESLAKSHLRQGSEHMKSNQYEQAIKSYKQAIKIEPDYASAYIDLGFAYAFLGRDKDAVEAFEVANKLKPNSLDDYIFFESFRALPQETIHSLQQIIRIYPDNKVAYSHLGDAYVDEGKYMEAIESYKQAIRIYPNSQFSYGGLGDAYTNLRKHKEAIESYKQAIKIAPEYEKAHYMLGRNYLILHKYSMAKRAFETVLNSNPQNAEAYFMLGVTAKNMYKDSPSGHEWGGQEFNYNRAIEINPDYAEAHYNLGVIYAKSHDIKKALEEYKILKKLDVEMADKLFDIIYDDS